MQQQEQVFHAVEQPATFDGNINEWLSANIRYPATAAEAGIQGRVVVSILIEKDGSISTVAVMRGVDKDLDKEAVRVVKSMPKWNPGKNNGVPVRSYFILPVTFRLKN